MGLKFGTSGVRGLAVDFTSEESRSLSYGFLKHFQLKATSSSGKCLVAGDFRESSPRIMKDVIQGIRDAGFEPIDAGFVPTPALGFGCSVLSAPGIMVTGSHIPGDRNGLKFYFPWGEVLKEDETPILKQKTEWRPTGFFSDQPVTVWNAKQAFIDRYLDFFGRDALSGAKIVFYEHSTLGREVMPAILEGLGAEVFRVARSEKFVPVDTEALGDFPELSKWIADFTPDAIVSADGDADRPLLLDERGEVVRGDQLGVLVAQELGADAVATPVSSNTALELSGVVGTVERTRIGSPYVIEGMDRLIQRGHSAVVGFEANGGFLVGSLLQSRQSGRLLGALPTRDSVLPVLAVLVAAKRRGLKLSQWVASLPERYTDSGLIKDFSLERAARVLVLLKEFGLPGVQKWFGSSVGSPTRIDETDGFRVSFGNSDILHLRPSGNAPEFRVYSESAQPSRANELVKIGMDWVTANF
jgi:phosphomannomutase